MDYTITIGRTEKLSTKKILNLHVREGINCYQAPTDVITALVHLLVLINNIFIIHFNEYILFTGATSIYGKL